MTPLNVWTASKPEIAGRVSWSGTGINLRTGKPPGRQCTSCSRSHSSSASRFSSRKKSLHVGGDETVFEVLPPWSDQIQSHKQGTDVVHTRLHILVVATRQLSSPHTRSTTSLAAPLAPSRRGVPRVWLSLGVDHF